MFNQDVTALLKTLDFFLCIEGGLITVHAISSKLYSVASFAIKFANYICHGQALATGKNLIQSFDASVEPTPPANNHFSIADGSRTLGEATLGRS